MANVRKWLVRILLPIMAGAFVAALIVAFTHRTRARERALVLACWHGETATAHRLLESGVNPNAIVRPDMDSDFDWWAHETFDPQDRMIFRMPAIEAAAFSDNVSIVHDLLAHGADPNFDDAAGTTALYVAATKGDEAMVRDLLNHRANPTLTWKDGSKPIDDASNGTIRALLKAKGG
ncbi:MAG: ankyrin repeat domain-containing protein [Fimbriimonadales bacterium]